jgi:MFS family permease
MPVKQKLQLNAVERRASLALAALFACRMLGLFLLLPVFAVAASGLVGGDDPVRIGLALGMYGLTQAVMQIPFGLASDRWGRRRVVVFGLLLFIVGSGVCAFAGDLFWVTIGRAIQGAGAISAAVMAWLADATREEVRTRAMAMVGGSIGLSFAFSLVLAPVLVGWGGLAALFWTIAALGVACLGVACFVVPEVPRTDARTLRVSARVVWEHVDLWRLNIGVFVLHLVQVALFVSVPRLLGELGGLGAQDLWRVYLPVIVLSFVLMVPVVFWTERRRSHRATLRYTVLGLAVVLFAMMAWAGAFYPLLICLTLFFVAFNILEALQPSLVARVAPVAHRGLALGFYNTSQAAGLFTGGALGGWLLGNGGAPMVFAMAGGLAMLWLVVAWTMRPLP